ncbi:protein conserved in the green lineage and diatoms 27, chloroplastic [Tanacetum coccineum]
MALLLTLKPPSPLTPPHLHHTTTLFPPKLKPKHPHFKPHFSSSFNNNPETNCPVPQDQQPINEYQSLSTSSPFSWASGDFVEYCSKLVVIGVGFGLFVGLPVSWYGSVGVGWELGQRVLAGVSSGLFVVTGVVVRMYLGWAYVGNRLLSATVEYIDQSNEWLMGHMDGKEEPATNFVYVDDDLTWAAVDIASGASEPAYPTRASTSRGSVQGSTSAPKGKGTAHTSTSGSKAYGLIDKDYEEDIGLSKDDGVNEELGIDVNDDEDD